MMAMLRQYLREATGHAHIILGEKREETIIHQETLNELAATTPDLALTFVLSDPECE